jgi:tetratricopeptide (TPR) repeat protein
VAPPKEAKPAVPEPPSDVEPVAFELDLDDLDASPPEVAREENPFDLAAELESAIVDDEADTATSISGLDATSAGAGPGFREVFGAFKRAIEEQLGEGESQAHYDLGIAYREMGLVDDAVREFELASRSEGRRVEALALLGACKIDAGQPQEALKDLEQALRLAGKGSEAALALRYERGRALAACGETDRALEEYRHVHRAAPEFRDVAERVEELASSRS